MYLSRSLVLSYMHCHSVERNTRLGLTHHRVCWTIRTTVNLLHLILLLQETFWMNPLPVTHRLM